MTSATSPETAEQLSAAYFRSVPWCAARLDSAPGPVTYWQPPWEGADADVKRHGDAFFATTLNTELTIPHSLFFFSLSSPSPHAKLLPLPSPPQPDALVPELLSFLHIESGIGGFPGYAHGGFVCTLLDEITGLLCTLNRARGALDRRPSMTGNLNTSFLKPVRAPSIVLARARIARIDGRKTWVEGWLEDESAEVLARAEVLFITLKGKL
jgi:acyl-coenzyme A thioesterase PaaI-like protein